MESNNQSLQEVPSESFAIAASVTDNSTNQELDELELDAIAGGCSDGADRERAAGIPVITTSQQLPFIPRLTIPMNVFDFLSS
ncbi:MULTISPECIES: hypothetical protein [unclassified Microcoleus]|uniref:hypothetical protein n=1 Tax=unclassified Microcoleus TaxID=2642155 RepID=UPI002FD70737